VAKALAKNLANWASPMARHSVLSDNSALRSCPLAGLSAGAGADFTTGAAA